MNLPLCEKYRPKTFDEVIGVSDLDKIKTLISDVTTMPNFLFYGSPGTGKTSCAKVMIDAIKPIDVLRINGSDTTGVDTIRDKVYNFMTSMSSIPNKPKLVWIEEFDFMSPSAFAALRGMIEQYMKNARFICTANFLYKIPEPIQSRFAIFEFKQSNIEEIEKRLKYICDTEVIKYDKDVLLEVIRKLNFDIRSCINYIQLCTKDIKIVDINYCKGLSEEVYSLIEQGKWEVIRYDIIKKSPDYNRILVDLADMFFNDDKYTINHKGRFTEIISEGISEMTLSFNKDIAFSAICSRLIRYKEDAENGK